MDKRRFRLNVILFCCVFVCRICLLGDRLLALDKIRNNDTGEIECNKLRNGSIYALFCGDRVTTDPETGRSLALDKIRNKDAREMECSKYENGSINALNCSDRVTTAAPETGQDVPVSTENDDYCRYFHEHNVTLRPGIPGLASGMFLSETLFIALLCVQLLLMLLLLSVLLLLLLLPLSLPPLPVSLPLLLPV